MVLSFTCNNCQAILSKNKILRHSCGNNSDNTLSNTTTDINTNNCLKSNENNICGILINSQQWNEFVVNVLTNYETNDENLKLVLNGLKTRRNFPRKRNKFYNFINAFLLSKNVQDCAKIIWEIVCNSLTLRPANKPIETENHCTQKRKLDDCVSHCQINQGVSEQKKAKLSEDLVTTVNANELESLTTNSPPVTKIEVLPINEVSKTEIEKPTISSAPETIIENLTIETTTATETVKPAIVQNFNEPITNRKLLWKMSVVERLSKYETNDENLKTVINCIINRKFLPRKEDRFMNLLGTIPMSRKVENCFKIIWDVIKNVKVNSQDEVPSISKQPALPITDIKLDKEFLNLLKMDGLKCLDSKVVYSDSDAQITEKTLAINEKKLEKPVQQSKQGYTNQEWHEKIQEALNKYQSTDDNLMEIITRLKTRKNIPQRFAKFQNYIRHISKSNTIENCPTILWNIILSGNHDTGSSAVLPPTGDLKSNNDSSKSIGKIKLLY